MKIVICGGHLSPAIALIDKIEKKEDILFVGRKYALEGDSSLSLEYKICEQKKINFASITAGRFQRSFTRYTIPALFKVPVGISQSMRILKKFKPDVVVGFGGYVSFPVVLAAAILRIPIVIHEQTLEAGFGNRFESLFAEKICISFEKSRNYFPKFKTVLTGNPVRDEIINPKSNIVIPSESIPLIYITGGSLGSVFINQLVERTLKELLENFRVVHQVGSYNSFEYLEKLKSLKKTFSNDLRKRYLVADHFNGNDVGLIMREASLVVGRAGINTVTELIYLNKPSLLIPLSVSQRNEQQKNAIFLKELGLAEVLSEKGITPTDFISAIKHMINHSSSYVVKADYKYIKENAAENILRVVENAAKNNQ